MNSSLPILSWNTFLSNAVKAQLFRESVRAYSQRINGLKCSGPPLKILFSIALFVLLSGCASTSMAPDRPDSIDIIGNPYASSPNPSLAKWNKEIDSYYKVPDALGNDRRRVRDDLVYATKAAVDHNYQQYSLSLVNEQSWTQTALDVAIFGLGEAGALTGGKSLKAILAATSAGLAATHASYVKNFFSDKTPQIIVARMDALRAAKWAQIYQKLGSRDDDSPSAYSFAEASSDLLEYYSAGTVLAAYQDINAQSGQQKTAADESIKNAVGLRFTIEATTESRNQSTQKPNVNSASPSVVPTPAPASTTGTH